MDRVQLKMDAKAAMQQANPHPVLVALVYMVILAAISFVISMMSGVSSVFTTLVSNPDAAAAIYAGMMIPSLLLSLVSTLVTGFLSMGFTAYTPVSYTHLLLPVPPVWQSTMFHWEASSESVRNRACTS